MTMTPSEQIASAEATAAFMEDFLEDINSLVENAREYRSNVSQEEFPKINYAATALETYLNHAQATAKFINRENVDFHRDGQRRLAEEQKAAADAAKATSAADARRALIERIAAELENVDIGANTNVVVHLAVIDG